MLYLPDSYHSLRAKIRTFGGKHDQYEYWFTKKKRHALGVHSQPTRESTDRLAQISRILARTALSVQVTRGREITSPASEILLYRYSYDTYFGVCLENAVWSVLFTYTVRDLHIIGIPNNYRGIRGRGGWHSSLHINNFYFSSPRIMH